MNINKQNQYKDNSKKSGSINVKDSPYFTIKEMLSTAFTVLALGIDKFKIDGRGIDKDTILSVIEPYMNEYYEGNLFDLMFSGRNTRRSISANLDNREVDGFVEKLFEAKIDCRYCGGKNNECKKLTKKLLLTNLKDKNF